jgi:gliding motility-associated-like protein
MKTPIFFLFFFFCCVSYSQVNLNQGLVLYLPFSGNTNDASGNGNNANNFNVGYTNDQFGIPNSACEFDGSTSFLQIPNSSSLQLGNEFTLCARVCPKGFYNGACFANAIIDKGWPDFSTGNYNLRFGVTYNPSSSCYGLDTNKENFTTQYSAYCGYSFINTIPYINLNNWYCVIGQYDGSNIKMYVDGVLRYQCSSVTPVGVNSQDLFIGKHGNPTYPYWFEGIMDEIRIYNRALNQQEIDSICNLVISSTLTANFYFNYPNPCDSTIIQFYDSSTSTGLITNWNWDFGDPVSGINNYSNLQNPTHLFSTSGNYTVKLISTNNLGISDTISTNISFFNNVNFANAGSNQTICPNDSALLQGNGGVTYSWSPNTSLSNPNISNPISYPTSTIVYTLSVINSNGCSDTAQVTVNVRTIIPLTITPDSSICEGDSVILNAIGGANLIWSPSTYLSTNIGPTVMCKPSSSVAYTIVYKDLNNCAGQQNYSVSVFPHPILTLLKSNDIECGMKSSQLNVSGANNYIWSPSNSLTNQYLSNPICNPNESTMYYVIGESNGCFSTDSIYVNVNGVSSDVIFIPSAFSPNGDDLNECFRVQTSGIIKSFKQKIFDRWGRLVFESDNIKNCWNGTTNGVMNELGVYYYYIKIQTNCDETFRKGDVLLMK